MTAPAESPFPDAANVATTNESSEGASAQDMGIGSGIGWDGIVRLGLVQMALGAIIVLPTSTLNRVMVVELALAAIVPGILVTLYHATQTLRPRWGHSSDKGGRLAPWIGGGMATLAAGCIAATAVTAFLAAGTVAWFAAALVAFVVIGIGVGAAGTNLLVLLATEVPSARRPAAAAIVWLMMIAGFALSAITVGMLLDPYSPERLFAVISGVAVVALLISLVALWGVERGDRPVPTEEDRKTAFRDALRQVWAEPVARRFSLFVFVAMFAYNAQDLILEPFSGVVFGFSPGDSTKLSGAHHGGVFTGMIAVGLIGTWLKGIRLGSLKFWMVGGCVGSALAFLGIVVGGTMAPAWPLQANVFVLGVANGAFAVAAIGSMMGFAGVGRRSREGVRMGVWGAAQAIASAAGGFLGAAGVDVTRALLGTPTAAYCTVFAVEGVLFLVAAFLALGLRGTEDDDRRLEPTRSVGDGVMAGVAGP